MGYEEISIKKYLLLNEHGNNTENLQDSAAAVSRGKVIELHFCRSRKIS